MSPRDRQGSGSGVAREIDAPSLLDPADWDAFRRRVHAALDVALDHVQHRPEQAVWRELPAAAKHTGAELPLEGTPLEALVAELQERVLPYTLGNTHPRFWGWVHGSGSASAVLSQAMIGALNANMGGRDHAPIYLERQVLRWLLQLFEFPAGGHGLFCTGTSTATLLGLAAARQRRAGPAVRRRANALLPGLVAYASDQAHGSVDKALELLGLGSAALRHVPVGDDLAMDTAALQQQIERDIAAGSVPFAVVSSAGSVNCGAIDALPAVQDICRRYGVWHHVDGAFGALAVLSPALRPRLAGIEQADSIAFDFHKWLHVTYATGCLLVRDGELLRETFATRNAYLQAEHQGIAGGAPWPNDYGIELSRGFSALAVWFQMREYGLRRLGQAIYRNCLQASWLAGAVAAEPALELLAPVALNIVCFRYRGSGGDESWLNTLNRRIVVELQCRGIAAPSSTELAGRVAIRVCLTNHRTRRSDLEALLEGVMALARELAATGDA